MEEPAKEKLIRIGLEWLKRGGVRSMKLRRICAEAELSPGTFTAYFSTLGEYKQRVLEHWYEPLQTEVQGLFARARGATEELRAVLEKVLGFFRPNAAVVIQLLLDASAGEQVVHGFLRNMQAGHINTVRRALLRAQEAGSIVSAPVEQQMFYLLGAVNMPVLFYHLLPEDLPTSETVLDALGDIVNEEKTLQRLDWALKGISL
ncbi:MAG: TetR/AcrR family transcriptional regulator [Akkermansia sp.]